MSANESLSFENTNEKMLTTIDNPYNPFVDFDSWYAFDSAKGYNSCSLLSRIANTSDQLSDFENSAEINRAIDEICSINASGMHTFVTRKGRI